MLESNVTRLTMLYRLNGAVQSWFDGIIMGWPSVLGHDLQASLERKVRPPQAPPTSL